MSIKCTVLTPLFKAAIHNMEAFGNYHVCVSICGFSCLWNWDLNLIPYDSNQNYTYPPCQLALLHSIDG
jgi:hypothetical protein